MIFFWLIPVALLVLRAFRLYHAALTADQIKAVMNGPVSAADPVQPAASWDFNEASGTTIVDGTGRGNKRHDRARAVRNRR